MLLPLQGLGEGCEGFAAVIALSYRSTGSGMIILYQWQCKLIPLCDHDFKAGIISQELCKQCLVNHNSPLSYMMRRYPMVGQTT